MSHQPSAQRKARHDSGKKRARLVLALSVLTLSSALAGGVYWTSTPAPELAAHSKTAFSQPATGSQVWHKAPLQGLSPSERALAIDKIIREKIRLSKAKAAASAPAGLAKADRPSVEAGKPRQVRQVASAPAQPAAASLAAAQPPAAPKTSEAPETSGAAEARALTAQEQTAFQKLAQALNARMALLTSRVARATAPDGDQTGAPAKPQTQASRAPLAASADQQPSETGQPADTLASAIPVPGQRPEDLAQIAREARAASRAQSKPQVLAYAPADSMPGEDDKRSAFSGLKKIFNSPSSRTLPGRGSGIAVYDISAATVHMPDGTKLEAHSGIGKMMDDPRYVHKKNLGPTPPNIYKLRMREARFHGVEAIRMLPQDIAAMRGRDGMLTHTNLLRGGRTGSHGCVAFKDYKAFLRAFKAGKVHTMVVVPRMKELPTYLAKL